MADPASAGRIRRLDDTLANQIAAGEVVERPASVLKELLENALDACPSRIEVDLRGGGTALVRVRDDGSGIHREDLILALERHATSKIAAFDDLLAVRTMGFRGEALPSIGSVSRLDIESRAAGADGGWRLKVVGGATSGEPEPTGHPAGTTVTVRDLFFNTPARRKFLRTERTELGHLDAVARRVALANPQIAFTVRHQDRELFSVPAARDGPSELRRLSALTGRGFAAAACAVDVAATGIALHGWVGAERAHADVQHFFVNARPVSDQVARHAVRVALEHAVPAGRHPAYVLFLDVDPREVDVNVHPAKREVRYREARLVHDFVASALARAVGGEATGADLALPGVGSPAGRMASGAPSPPARTAVAETLSGYAALARDAAQPRALAIPGGRYLAYASRDGLAVVDLARARRAWLARRALDGAEQAARPLLVPVSRAVAERVAECVETRLEALGALGVDARRVAPGTLSLRGVPRLLERIEPGALLDALIDVAGTPRAPVAAAQLRDAMLGALDLAGAWRDDPRDTAAMLDQMDTLGQVPGVRAMLDAPSLARIVGEA